MGLEIYWINIDSSSYGALMEFVQCILNKHLSLYLHSLD